MPELNFLGWLRGKKEEIINGDNDFQNALDDALRISKLKPYINTYNWKGINFTVTPKTGNNLY